jgi:Zn-dependent M28 family amino/carboxypeptidase
MTIRRFALVLIASTAASAAYAQAPAPMAPAQPTAVAAPAVAGQTAVAPRAVAPSASAPAAARPAPPPAPYRPEVLPSAPSGPAVAQGAAPAPMAPGAARASSTATPSFTTTLALRDRALTDNTAWTLLESLTTDIGGRPVGSPAMTRAKDWAIERMHALGFENVHVEPFAKPSWVRGPESAELVTPYHTKLQVIGLGNSASGQVTGEIVVFKSLAALRMSTANLAGKIVVVNQPMTRTQDGSGYGAAGAARFLGPSIASAKGAAAYLTRSISTADLREPHTGGTNWQAGVKPIPAGALGVPDADLLERLAKRPGKAPTLTLALMSSVDTKATAWNIVGDLRGSERPDEIIVIGGHLDSWDPGEGAIDDGAGIAITAAAAKLIGDLPTRPKRTIRVVMFGSEETGGSSAAFLAAHKAEVPRMVLTGESDTGGDEIYDLRLPPGFDSDPRLLPVADALAPLKVFLSGAAVGEAGSDVAGIQDAGVPAFGLSQNASRYFDLHHSASDTLDKVDPAKLAQNVAAWVTLIHFVADSDIDFRQPARK